VDQYSLSPDANGGPQAGGHELQVWAGGGHSVAGGTKDTSAMNLGLRYEMATMPTEIHSKLANLRNLTDANPHLGDPFFVSPNG